MRRGSSSARMHPASKTASTLKRCLSARSAVPSMLLTTLQLPEAGKPDELLETLVDLGPRQRAQPLDPERLHGEAGDGAAVYHRPAHRRRVGDARVGEI